MKLDDDFDYEYDYEERRGKVSLGTMAIVVSMFILAILVVVVIANPRLLKKSIKDEVAVEQESVENAQLDAFGYPATSELVNNDGLRPEDLDFWDMYPKESSVAETDTPTKEELEKAEKEAEEEEKKQSANNTTSNKEQNKTELQNPEEKKDPLDDGKHTLVELADGTTEWVVISPYLAKNSYDFTKLKESKGLKYMEDGKKVSFTGVDISKYQESVDFYQLKEAGIDYVMLRVGARGYSSGQIKIDENFAENIKKATEAGLDIGLYFYSQALTEAEAVEEANVVLQQIQGYTIKYPIAFDMEYVDNDTARVEKLSKADKTTITKAFLDTIAGAGYRPMIYGDKEWLIKKIDLSKLETYDVWLSQEKDTPDYPYKYTMWQYSTTGKINGISGYADLNICFIDYSAK